jgi:pimeloyl-ACP methyl ester carboxylesterase
MSSITAPRPVEQTRARYPDREGLLDRGGVRIHWESYGAGDPAVMFLPTWSIVHSRIWKMQIPDFARRHHVITFDGRGNGGSDRPTDTAAYLEDEFAADALAVMDECGVDRAVVVGVSLGGQRGLILAGEHPERVAGLVLIAPGVRVGVPLSAERRSAGPFEEDSGIDEGWARFNAHSWRRDFPGFLQFFFEQVFTEPHSSKPIEDCVGWGLETDPETLIVHEAAPGVSEQRTRDLCSRVQCPVLVIHGDEDAITPHGMGEELARLAGGRLVTFSGSGHCPQGRDPVRTNLELRAFLGGGQASSPAWTRARNRPRRALYVSSPIGLGHAWRDVAIARELRRLVPDLEIDWLAQDPVTRVLDGAGERIHPMSAELASESAHFESESSDHELHAFQATRRMDEILLANFMVFHDAMAEGTYDLCIADEGWDVDHYLHENPELKRSAYCWLTDFVGWLPMPAGGGREAALTADYNAEMLEQIDRFPHVRDRAIFIGEPEDIVPDRFGPGLPGIRDWTVEHYRFAGYVSAFDTGELGDRDALRAELGYDPDELVCIVTPGGTGVGGGLLRRAIQAFPEAKRRVPALRMIAVCGPRLDPADMAPAPDGLELRPYVHELRRHLAACDLAVCHGGLATTMELVAARRPFIYFPLAQHFEQNLHVHYRLQRHGAGRRMEFAGTTADDLAQAIAEEIGCEADYLPVPDDGATRAAAMIAELV